MKNILFLLFFLPLSLVAQNDTINQKLWTWQECLDYAFLHNTQIARSVNNIQYTKAGYEQSIANLLPAATASANQYFNFGRSLNTVTNQFAEIKSQTNNFGINSSILVFNGLQYQHRVQQSRFNFKASIQDAEQTRNDITLSILSTYIQLLLNKELLSNAVVQLQSTGEQLARTQKLVEAGTLAQSSYLEIKAQKANEELNLINAENQLDLSKLKLKQLLQLPYDSTFEVVVPELGQVTFIQLEKKPSEVYEIAIQSQPSVRSAEWKLRAAQFGEKSSVGSFFPRLSLFGRMSTNYFAPIQTGLFTNIAFEDQINNNLSKQIGIDLQIPILNSFQNRLNWQQNVVTRKNAELNLIDAKTTLRQNVEQAYLDAKAAYKKYYAAKTRLEALQESFRMTEQKFGMGIVSALDFTISKNNLQKAESDLTVSKYEYVFRMKTLDFYQNKPITF